MPAKPVFMVDEFKQWVPNARHPFDQGSCHLTVDGDSAEHLEALHAFAAKIGMRREWFQAHPRHPHYDLTEPRRRRAIRAGAVFVPAMAQAEKRLARRPASETGAVDQ